MPITLLDMIWVLLLAWLHVSTSTETTTSSSSLCTVSVKPEDISLLQVGSYQSIDINCSCCHNYAKDHVITAHILAQDPGVAKPTKINKRQQTTGHGPHYKPTCTYGRRCVSTNFIYNTHPIYVEANNVGRTKFKVEIVIWNVSNPSLVLSQAPGKIAKYENYWNQTLTYTEITISTVRKQRLIDRAFEWSVAVIACILALCMGCMTDFHETKPFFRRPLALIASLVTQHILMPPVAYGLFYLFSPPKEIGIGLITMSAMPGGGLAHLTVYLMTGERDLSAAISFTNAALNLVMTPIWLVIMCYAFRVQVSYGKFAIWLVPLFLTQLGGALLATCKRSAAQALLNWVGRPILLLASILMVTLGIYINHYAIDHLDTIALICVVSFIATGFGLGGLVGIITKQAKPKRKTIAAETACFACLMAIPAIRYSMPAPDNDLATIVPLAGTILTPTPIIIYLVAHKAKGVVMGFIDKRKEKQSRHYSIVSSLAKMAEEVTAVSTPLVIDPDKDSGAEKQKVTTL